LVEVKSRYSPLDSDDERELLSPEMRHEGLLGARAAVVEHVDLNVAQPLGQRPPRSIW
jgi:hypothetical protein